MFLLVDHELDGRQAGDRLHRVAVTVDRNAVPFDPRPPTVSGTGALADRHPLDAEVPA